VPNLGPPRPEFQQALHHWYRLHRRRLPWRERPSLYRTVVSEFMLQQTQVATVLPYFDRWMRALPDFAALAAAPESRVLKLWEGLGYYSRARRLQLLARVLAARPKPPRTTAEWQELPGVGPYTAAAIASIAGGEPAACVDGNVVRLLARLTGETRRFRDGSDAARHFAPLAAELIAGADPGDHNQAMMELGATVCRRRNPRCEACPVAKFCAGRRSGRPELLPRLAPKPTEKRTVDRAWCLHRGRLLLQRTDARARRLAGLYELPELAAVASKTAITTLLSTKHRTITRFAITEKIHRVEAGATVRRLVVKDQSLKWVPLTGLGTVTLSGPHRKWIGQILDGGSLAGGNEVASAGGVRPPDARWGKETT